VIKYLMAFLLSALIFSSIFCSRHEEIAPDHKPLVMRGQQGKSVFEVLLEHYKVEYTKSEMGVVINSIDGVKNEGGHFWIYSINGKPGEISADKALVSDEDTIEWRYK